LSAHRQVKSTTTDSIEIPNNVDFDQNVSQLTLLGTWLRAQGCKECDINCCQCRNVVANVGNSNVAMASLCPLHSMHSTQITPTEYDRLNRKLSAQVHKIPKCFRSR
jgi:hypothetical protein